MALRMTGPTKRKGSENWHYRRRIPADVRAILAKRPRSQWPPSWFANEICISLRTADRAEAKARFPDVAAKVERMMAALRAGPQRLTSKQVSALAGELYKAFADTLEEDAGHSAGLWLQIARENEDAQRGQYGAVAMLSIRKTGAVVRQRSMEERFGELADAMLIKRGLQIDQESRWALIERAAIELTQAARKLARNADGDYTPDAYKERFPTFKSAPEPNRPQTSLTALLSAWHSAALFRMTARDAGRMKSRMEKFVAFLGHDSIERTTTDDVIRYADHRRQTASYATVNKSDLASIKNVFGWAAERPRAWIAANPAAGVKAEGKKKARLREPYFTQFEISAILSAASEVKPSKREAPKTTAAKRWVPWLCAYSGARVTEMIQLRKQDIRHERDGWFIRLSPEAGNIKTDEFRDVPVHEHLIELGFIAFVDGSYDGPLFCNVGKEGSTAGPSEGVYQRIRTLVRGVVAAASIQPNHAWRYTFKTFGVEAEIPPLVLDAICGHAPRTKGGEYSRVTTKALAAAMQKFPRYNVDSAP